MCMEDPWKKCTAISRKIHNYVKQLPATQILSRLDNFESKSLSLSRAACLRPLFIFKNAK